LGWFRFLLPKDTKLKFISKNLKQLLEKNKVSNLDMENIKTISNYSYGDSEEKKTV